MGRLGLLVATILILLSGCTEQQVGNGLVYCSEGDPETFNPQLSVSGTTIDATAKQLYNRLLQIDPVSGDLIPDLAIDWQISEDRRQYLFTLRQGVAFHQTEHFTPNRDFNADDVVFSFERWLLRSNPFFNVGGARYPYFQSMDLDQIGLTIVKVSDYQVRFDLVQPRPNFLAELATDFAVILSKQYGVEQLAAGTPNRIDSHPVGTGPFKLRQYLRNQYIRYDRHPDYWGTAAKLDQLVFDITPSATTRVIKLIGGDCDVAALPKVSELGTIQSYDDLAVDVMPGLNVSYWAFNTNRPPLDNAHVRRALSLAINKPRILKVIYQTSAVASKGMLPPISWAYNRDFSPLEHQPEMAKRMLQQAGVGEFSVDILVIPTDRIYNPDPLKSAELIQQDLAEIGVTANLIHHDWNRFSERLRQGDYDSVLIGWSADNLDPDNFFSPLLSCAALSYGSNRARWCDPEFDKLIYQARNSLDIKQRKQLYNQLELRLRQQMPLMPFAHSSRLLGRKRHWQGQMLHPSGGIDFSKVGKETL